MRKRVLVTGSDGQLGKSIQKLVKENNYNLDFVLANKDLLDISKEEELEVFFKENTFDYCVNCAAYTAVDKAEEEEKKAFLVNAESVRILAKNCKKQKVILIHVSTDFVFDGQKNEPYIETDSPNPINIYGASKLKGEKFIEEILETYYIIRTSWVYSEFGNNFVKTMLRLANERDEISVVNDQIGCPTYAEDLSNFIIEIILKDNDRFGVYHFCNQGALSWYDFAKQIIDFKDLDCSVKPILSKDFKVQAKRPKYSVLNSTKTFLTFKALQPKNVIESLNKCLFNL